MEPGPADFFGRPVEILVNNAGFFYDVVPLIDMTDAQVSKTIDIDLKGTMYMSREVCKRLVDASSGLEISPCTTQAFKPMPSIWAFSSSHF